MFLWWQKQNELKNALKGLSGADPFVAMKYGTMDTTAATKVSKSDWQNRRGSAKGKVNTFALCLILSLSICYNHPFRSWLAEFRSVWLSSHSSVGLPSQTAPSNYSSATKQNILRNLCGSNLAITPATLTPLKWPQGEPILPAVVPHYSDSRQRELVPQPVNSPKLIL